MCQWGANRNLWVSYRMCPSPTPKYPQTVWLQIGDHRLSASCGVVSMVVMILLKVILAAFESLAFCCERFSIPVAGFLLPLPVKRIFL